MSKKRMKGPKKPNIYYGFIILFILFFCYASRERSETPCAYE